MPKGGLYSIFDALIYLYNKTGLDWMEEPIFNKYVFDSSSWLNMMDIYYAEC